MAGAGPLRVMIRAMARARSGAALIEFALVAPVLTLLLAATWTTGDALICARKAERTANTLADLTSRYASVQAGDLATVTATSALVLAPCGNGTALLRVSEITALDANHALVVWSHAQGGSPLTAGATITLPANAVPPLLQPATRPVRSGASFVLGEVSYVYHPDLDTGILPALPLSGTALMLPRLGTQVPLL